MNGLRLKVYNARLMMIVKDEEYEEESYVVKDVAIVKGEDLASLFAAADHE